MPIFANRSAPRSLTLMLVAAILAFSGCASTDSSENSGQESPEASVPEAIEIPSDTLVGDESTRILDILNADEDTSAQDWDDVLHETFTAEVSVDELVELLNQSIRPAQPFEAINYEGNELQAVTT